MQETPGTVTLNTNCAPCAGAYAEQEPPTERHSDATGEERNMPISFKTGP
jgi:hypothetical protein